MYQEFGQGLGEMAVTVFALSWGDDNDWIWDSLEHTIQYSSHWVHMAI